MPNKYNTFQSISHNLKQGDKRQVNASSPSFIASDNHMYQTENRLTSLECDFHHLSDTTKEHLSKLQSKSDEHEKRISDVESYLEKLKSIGGILGKFGGWVALFLYFIYEHSDFVLSLLNHSSK